MSSVVQLGGLSVGDLPRVVGTIVVPEYFRSSAAAMLPCDLVEVRLDHLLEVHEWIDLCQGIEARRPVLLTLRSALEGGAFKGSESERFEYYQKALPYVSAVDIELHSPMAEQVCAAAQAVHKACILSFHNFQETPSDHELAAIIDRAESLGGIVKISTMPRDEQDVQRLRRLLARPRSRPLCVIAMGALGTTTRVSFAAEGSCLTYGYLDRPGAPGQLSAGDLVTKLSEMSPAYAADAHSRRKAEVT